MEADRAFERLEIEKAQVADAQRDPRRFSVLYEENFDRVYAFVAQRTGDRTEAEDLTATVFQKALAGLHRFEWRGVPFIAWLIRIARNELADHRTRERSIPVSNLAGDEPVVELQDVDRRAELYGCVRALPEDQRRVVVLRFVEQRSIKEIAAALGRSDGAVKQLQFPALTKLRSRMSDDDA